jgi:transposase InsO family protein
MGCRKLYEKLEPFMLAHQIKMGRDALFKLLAENQLLVRRTKKKHFTTNSFHWLRKYPNMIRDLVITRKNQLWVSDITYWKSKDVYYYISLVTDAFSHKVVGYQIAETLEAVACIDALRMALNGLSGQEKGLIHHSDRGIQYCSQGYVKLLQDYQVEISMTENGDPLENPVAERINGIIKNEYLFDLEMDNLQNAKIALHEAIQLYNYERPHLSIGMLTPQIVHHNDLQTEKLWKNYYPKRNDIVNQFQDVE